MSEVTDLTVIEIKSGPGAGTLHPERPGGFP